MATERGYMPDAIVKKTNKKYKEVANDPYDLWAVVEHIAEGGPNSWLYLQITGPGSSHFFVTKTGKIYQLASIFERTWCNGLNYENGKYIDPQGDIVDPPWWRCDAYPGIDPNKFTISVEHEGWTGEIRTPAMIAADVAILAFIGQQTGLTYTVGDTLIRHADISPKNRAHCPGVHFDMDALARMANAAIGVDPLRVRKIVDAAGKPWYCGEGFFTYYNQAGALRAFGYPRSDEYRRKDQTGEEVTVMRFERQWLKYKASEQPWPIRPMLIDEIIWMQSHP